MDTKLFEIEDKRVLVVDRLISESDLHQYVVALDGASFSRTEFASPESRQFRHFVSEMPLASLVQLPLFGVTKQLCEQHFGATRIPYRAYTNLALPGDALHIHTDCLADQQDCTALWYFCERWEANWAGETVFLDSQEEIALSVLPKPGRLVIFDGRIRHAGRPPSTITPVARYTFAIKFEKK